MKNIKKNNLSLKNLDAKLKELIAANKAGNSNILNSGCSKFLNYDLINVIKHRTIFWEKRSRSLARYSGPICKINKIKSQRDQIHDRTVNRYITQDASRDIPVRTPVRNMSQGLVSGPGYPDPGHDQVPGNCA